ncbi:MAG: ferrous iron transport protein B [Polyangiaceae bacterium]|nr:ferrous iron transport protein B [Polyangiaceae bacterium]
MSTWNQPAESASQVPKSPSHEPKPVAGPARRPVVVVVGNPNVGKTSLFNRLTGQSARVGNYPGVTVERLTGRLDFGDPSSAPEVVDVPGTYSLAARSPEEQIAIGSVIGLFGHPKPDLVVFVVDAGQLIRNLYLALQLVELKVPLVIALNMVDEVTHDPPNAAAIGALFRVPCIPTNGRTGLGADALKAAILEALAKPPEGRVEVAYPAPLKRDRDRVADALPAVWKSNVERDRALALWALSSVDEDDELSDIGSELRERCLDVRKEAVARDLDQEIIVARYGFLDQHARSLYQNPEASTRGALASERVDRFLLHPVAGFAVFLLVMLLVFQALFSWSDPAIGLIEQAVVLAQEFAAKWLPDGTLRDLLTEGVLGGVGNVIVFLPQIALLFMFIGILEDSGYMARVAFLMDRVMKSLGLHGRAFVPMLSGFACAVPAILATRTMERRRDRLLTMLVVPLMTCSARLPVYTLIVGALFPKAFGWVPVQASLMVSMYVFALVMTLFCAWVLGRTVVRGRRIPLILELPPYRLPQAAIVLRMVWQRSLSFLREAGGVILVCTVVLWGLLSFPKVGPHEAPTPATSMAAAKAADSTPHLVPADIEAEHAQRQLQQSYGGRLGKFIEPALTPLGFDWKIGVGLIGAFAAREVFVSTLGLVYGIGDTDGDALSLRERIRNEKTPLGKPSYTPLMGLSLLVFFALACQCMSTLAVVHRETRSWRWPAFMLAYMTALAYAASFLVYQGGLWLGLG